MAFNVNEFKSIVNKYGGLSHSNLFMVQLFGGNIFTDKPIQNDIRFFCKTVTFPGIGVNVFDNRPNNIDIPQSYPMTIEKSNLDCVFMLDEDNQVLTFFHKWMQSIVNFTDDFSSDGKAKYEIGYKDEYAQTMVITRFNRTPSNIIHNEDGTFNAMFEYNYTCKLYDVFPVRLGTLNLSWEDGNNILTLPVDFTYGEIEMSGVKKNEEVMITQLTESEIKLLNGVF